MTEASPLIEQPLMLTYNGRVEGVLVRGETPKQIAQLKKACQNFLPSSRKKKVEGQIGSLPRVRSKQQFWLTARYSGNGLMYRLLMEKKKKNLRRLKGTMN